MSAVPVPASDPFHDRAALAIAHPGHELRVHGWLERTNPLVFVLTDGSGQSGESRLASTTALLERAGAAPGPIYGRLTDKGLYQAILDRDTKLFHSLADELAAALERERIEVLVGDAVEGHHPGHDVWRLLLNAAVERLGPRAPANFEFPLEAAPDEIPEEVRSESLRLELDAPALERKLAAARAYPEMAVEVEWALTRYGEAAFQAEWLRPVRYGLEIGHLFPHPPFYEVYGEMRVEAGLYQQVLRFQKHLAPLAESLAERTERS